MWTRRHARASLSPHVLQKDFMNIIAHNLNVLCSDDSINTYNYKCKENFVILKSIGIITIKVEKQGQSSTPADILVDNLIPNSVH